MLADENDDDDEDRCCLVTSSRTCFFEMHLVAMACSLWPQIVVELVVGDEPRALEAQRYEKISNKSSFGIIDIADESSTSDRIIVIVDTACFIHDGAYR